MASGLSNLIRETNPELTIKVVPGGGTANPTKVNRGRSQLGWGLDTLTYQASKGEVLFENKAHDDLMMIGMSFSDLYTHFIRAQNAPYDSIEELLRNGRNAKIGVIKRGSSGEQAFRWLMENYGVDYQALRKRGFKINHGSFSELSSQFKDGQVDYVFGNLGLPAAVVIDMSQARKLEIMNFDESLLSSLNQSYGFLSGNIPAGTYENAGNQATTLKMATTLVVNRKVSDDVVYSLTKTLCENQERLTTVHASMSSFECSTAFNDSPAPLHPGAVKYYREKGFL